MTGRYINLNPYNQEVLATWIAMKMLVADFLTPDDVFASSLDRSLFMGRRLPPDNMTIWIGRYLGSEATNLYYRHGAVAVVTPIRIIPRRPPPGTKKNLLSQTFIIGELFAHAISTTTGLTFNVPPKFAETIRRIWPYQHAVAWPPVIGMSDEVARDVATGLNNVGFGRPLATQSSRE
ncbi:MAG: hypothetical protein WB760_18635 [Xanthobacteraceae bacterium]